MDRDFNFEEYDELERNGLVDEMNKMNVLSSLDENKTKNYE